jgi:LmbE family N-acetylglucosaminyl deacetylase
MSERRLLAVLAHPDDESFPIGGTLAKYAAEGISVILVCATRGQAGVPDMGPIAAGRLREGELRYAAQVLGLAEVRILDYWDGMLSGADEEHIVAGLKAIMKEVQPQVVITFGPDGISGHPDHVAISRFTTLAFDQSGVKGALFYVSPLSALRGVCGVTPPREEGARPLATIDVSGHLVTKVKAMQCHASQHQPYPGNPQEEATRLACHEYFTLARPTDWAGDLTDLFAVVP